MIPLSSSPKNSPTVEQGINALAGDVKRRVTGQLDEVRQSVRATPGRAILIAMAGGYLLHRLPVRSLLVAQVRLLAALAPPTLVAFGAAKLCEFLQTQAHNRPSRGSSVGNLDEFV